MLPGFTTGLGKHVWGHKAWITVGFAVYLGILVAAPFSGASLNPAVVFSFFHDCLSINLIQFNDIRFVFCVLIEIFCTTTVCWIHF
jgi:glycerol uptake facilitator-like aquaporin